jgi:hypothetical protein
MRLLGMEKVAEAFFSRLDDLMCTLAFLGYRPSWYKEWYARS